MMMKIKGLRWWIIVLLCMGTIINYLARNSLGLMAPVLEKELNFTTQEYSYVVGAFQLAYAFMQPVAGYVIDFLGLKLGFVLFVVLWSVANCLHGFATGWQSLAIFRGLLGVTEASAIPAGMKTIAVWFPDKERSVATGFFNAGTSLGSMLAPPLVIFIQIAYGWQAAFIVTGGLGFVFAILWWIFFRTPAEHPALSDTERNYIHAGQPAAVINADGSEPKPRVREIISAGRFWGIALPRALAEPAWQTFSFWIPLYLFTVRHMDLQHIAMFAWMPFLLADVGGICGGYLSPFFMKHFGFNLVRSRLAGIVVGAIFMIGPGCIGLAPDAYTAIALFSIGGFAHQMISALLNTLSADVFPAREVGTANGLTGMISWIGGLSFSLVVGQLAGTIGYNPLFVCLTIFDIIGATIAISLLRNIRVGAAPLGGAPLAPTAHAGSN